MKIIPDSRLSLQFKKPAGIIGKYVVGRMMDTGNAGLHKFTLEQMDIQAEDSILEIGFGTGKVLKKIKEASPGGFTAGIDFSWDMLQMAMKHNRDYIKDGSLELRLSDISQIPYKSGTFDKIFTANTLYFWPDPVENAKEIMRVLKKNGKLYIGFRLKEELMQLPVTETNFTRYTEEELKMLFESAGYDNFEMRSSEGGSPFPSHTAIISKNI